MPTLSTQRQRLQTIGRVLALGLVALLFFLCNDYQPDVFRFLRTDLLPGWLPRQTSAAQVLNYTFLLSDASLAVVNIFLSLQLIYLLSLDWKYTRLAAAVFVLVGLLTVASFVIKRVWFNAAGAYPTVITPFLLQLLHTPLLALLLGVAYRMRKPFDVP